MRVTVGSDYGDTEAIAASRFLVTYTCDVRPSEAQLAKEQKGRVNIYDSMRESDVDWALDTQFERIDSMMFVRTIRVTEAGELEMDGDCD